MKGVDDFLILLVVAIVIIVFFVAIGPIKTGEFEQIARLSVGEVGVSTTLPSRSTPLGSLTIGEAQREQLKSIPQLEVSTSYFDVKKYEFEVIVADWFLSDARGVRITADVYEANRLNDLVIKWNGKEFYRGKPDIISISIPKENIKGSNNFEVYAEGPGIAFWTANSYVLRNTNIQVEYGPAKLVPFQMLGTDIESFSRAELNFYAVGSNPVVVKVNGKEISSRVPRGAETLSFDFSNITLKTGVNMLSISSDKPINLYDTRLDIYLTTGQVAKTLAFNLTSSQYNSIQYGRGRMDFSIGKISAAGSLRVKLNDKPLNVPQLSVGTVPVYFTHNDVRIGGNVLDVSGTGSFYISEVKIGIER